MNTKHRQFSTEVLENMVLGEGNIDEMALFKGAFGVELAGTAVSSTSPVAGPGGRACLSKALPAGNLFLKQCSMAVNPSSTYPMLFDKYRYIHRGIGFTASESRDIRRDDQAKSHTTRCPESGFRSLECLGATPW